MSETERGDVHISFFPLHISKEKMSFGGASSFYHVVNKENWQDQKFLKSPIGASTSLSPGQVLARLSSFNISANNVTYAGIGKIFGYWGFFPAAPDNPELGRVPVWGTADVVKSQSANIKPGDRLYGYFPVSTYAVLEGSLSADDPAGVVLETSEYRSRFWPVYQRYRRMPAERKHTEEEAFDILFYIPYLTAYGINRSYGFTEAGNIKNTVIILSASSKCGYSLARILKRSGNCTVIGVSSAENTKLFSQATGWYHKVYTYGELNTGLNDDDSSRMKELFDGKVNIVDFSGRAQTVVSLQKTIGPERLGQTILVGGTDSSVVRWDSPSFPAERFFLPGDDHLEKNIKDDGGLRAFNAAFEKELRGFISEIIEGGMITISHKQGTAAVEERWKSLLIGHRNPSQEVFNSL